LEVVMKNALEALPYWLPFDALSVVKCLLESQELGVHLAHWVHLWLAKGHGTSALTSIHYCHVVQGQDDLPSFPQMMSSQIYGAFALFEHLPLIWESSA